MSVTSKITGDCRHMSITMSVSPGQALVEVSNGNMTWTAHPVIPVNPPTYNTVISLSDTVGTNTGIFTVKVTDSAGNVSTSASFAPCDLLCCISKKLETIIGCDCACTKCNHHLITAERVNLLILAIETTLQRVGDNPTEDAALLENARRKYHKALELCSDSCGCNC